MRETENGFAPSHHIAHTGKMMGEGWWDIRRYRPIIFAALLVPALSACSTLNELVGTYAGEDGLALLGKAAESVDTIEDATIGNAVKVVPLYCDNLPGAARSVFRARVNGRPEIGGAMIGIWCPGDDVLTLGAP